MRYLDPRQPDAITWDLTGTGVTSDGYERHFTEQAGLRERANTATTPRITVKALARRSGISENTLRFFMRGRALQPEHEESLRAALLEVEP